MTSTTLIAPDLFAAAAAPHAQAVAVLADRPLTGVTPCSEWDVRGLVRHLLYWTPVLAATGRRAVPAPPAAEESAVVVGTGWGEQLAESRAELVAAWSDPAAWVGAVAMDGPGELPAPMIGGMVFGELVLHGWDLARAAGLKPAFPEEVVVAALPVVRGMAEEGRAMGIFGAEVLVPRSASTLARVVAASGRAPADH